MEKDWSKRPSDHQLQEAQKKVSDRAITLAAEAVHAPAHLAPPGSPQPKQLCYLHAQISHWQSCNRQTEVLCLGTQGRFSCVQCFVTLWTMACQVSPGGSPGKNTGVYWTLLVAIPFYSTIFPAALAANSPEYLVLPEPLQPKQLHHHCRADSGASPSGRPACRGGNKTTAEIQGQCGYARRPKTFPSAVQASY